MKYLKYILILFLLIPINALGVTEAPVDITTMSITDLRDALDKGYLTSELLVTLYLERIEAYDEEFNAIRELNENALEEAKILDQERANGNIRSALHGIPIVVKTNIDVKELATTAGASALSDNYPSDDAEVIAKLKEAGAIILASTNMSEFAFSARNSYSSYGSVHNAFNTSATPYGSSGGSGVAVATTFAAASLGTDTNSSVRVPASAAGLVGLRPTYGLISTDGVIPYDILRDTVGIMTKTVEDNALILSIITNEEIEISSNNTKKLKVGVIESYMTGSSSSSGVHSLTDPEITKLMEEKLELLKNAGVELVYIDTLLTNKELTIASDTMTGGSFCDGFNEYIKGTTGKIYSFNDLAYSSGHVYSITDYLSDCDNIWQTQKGNLSEDKEAFENHVLEVMEENDVDIFVYPTTKNKVPDLSDTTSLISPGSALASVIGYPSLTVPMGYIDEFSYGMEFFSKKNQEKLLYQVASLFENANNLELTNSALTPSLYVIPEYITNLKATYEQYYHDQNYNDITSEVKAYFLSYSSLEGTSREEEANHLIEEYEIKTKDIENSSYHSNIIYVVLAVIIATFLIRLFLVWKKDRKEDKIYQNF